MTHSHWLPSCHTDILTHSLIDTRTDWTDSLLDRHTHSLSHSRTDIFTDRRTVTLTEGHSHRPTYSFTDSLLHSQTDTLFDWHTKRLTHILTDTLSDSQAYTLTDMHCQTRRPTHSLTDTLSPLQTDTFIDWQIRWLTHCHTFRLTHLLTFTVLHNDWLTPPLDRHIYWLFLFIEAALVTAGIPHLYHSHFYTHTMAQSFSVILQQFDCFQSNLVRELVS